MVEKKTEINNLADNLDKQLKIGMVTDYNPFKKREVYVRNNNHSPGEKVVESLIKQYGKNTQALVLPSGMNAIATAFHSIFIDNGFSPVNIIHGNELYCDTFRTIKYFSNSYLDCFLQDFDVKKSKDLMNIVDTKIKKNLLTILFIESCTNPSSDVFNFEVITELRKKLQKLVIIVDNTWITSVFFNPFSYDVDLVVNSLTKYYSGGLCIAGALLAKQENRYFKHAQYWSNVMGLHVSPYNCSLIAEKLKDINDRVTKTAKVTQEIALFLKENKLNVNYLGLDTHPSNALMKKFFKNNGPSVLTIILTGNKRDVVNWMEGLNKKGLFKYVTSFGSSTSRFDTWPVEISETKTQVRFSVGYNDEVDDLKKRLKLAFADFGVVLK